MPFANFMVLQYPNSTQRGIIHISSWFLILGCFCCRFHWYGLKYGCILLYFFLTPAYLYVSLYCRLSSLTTAKLTLFSLFISLFPPISLFRFCEQTFCWYIALILGSKTWHKKAYKAYRKITFTLPSGNVLVFFIQMKSCIFLLWNEYDFYLSFHIHQRKQINFKSCNSVQFLALIFLWAYICDIIFGNNISWTFYIVKAIKFLSWYNLG